MFKHSRFYLLLIIGLAALPIMLGSCTTETNQNQGVQTTTSKGTTTAPAASEAKKRENALVRVIHAVPGSPAVDIFADDAKVFSSISYKSVTPYKEISGERHTFRVRAVGKGGNDPALAENSEGLGDGKHYTVVAEAGADNKPTIYIYNDDLVPPSSGKAKVRVINASPDELDLYTKGKNDKLFGGVNGMKETSYNSLDPVTGPIEIRPSGKTNATAMIANAKFEAGKIYTIVITGRTQGAPAKLEAMIIEDQFAGGTTSAANTNDNMNANHNLNANKNGNVKR